jgi:hypothetical protein
MTLDEAVYASPLHVALNATGRDILLICTHTDGMVAVFKRMPDTNQ